MKYCFKSIAMLIKKYPSYLVEEILSVIMSVLYSIVPIYIVRDIIRYFQEGKTIKDIIIYVVIIFLVMAILSFIMFVLSLYKMNIQRLFVAKTSEEFYKRKKEKYGL